MVKKITTLIFIVSFINSIFSQKKYISFTDMLAFKNKADFPADVFSYFQKNGFDYVKKLNSPFFRKGKDSISIHGIIHLTWPVADHVVPWNLGGLTNLENLVSACAPCNYGKDGNTLEQLGLNNPFERAPVEDIWDGFVRRIEALRR